MSTGLNAKSPPCLVCTNKITKTQACVMCHVCQRWTHTECSKIAPELYKYLVKENRQGFSINWCCEACSVASELLSNKVAAMFKDIQDIKNDISQLQKDKEDTNTRVTKLETRCDEYDNKEEQLKSNVEKNVFQELRDREEKKNNLIIHGIPEVNDDSWPGLKKKELDIHWTGLVVDTLEVKINPEKDIKFIRRLGEKKVDSIRPLQVGFHNIDTKSEIMKKCRSLADNEFWDGVYLVPDLTLQQRKEEDNLIVEMHKRNSELSEEQALNSEWKVVGPKGQKRLILAKKSTHQTERWGRRDSTSWTRRGGGSKRQRTPESITTDKRTRPSMTEEEENRE
jgi:hypothetical protein